MKTQFARLAGIFVVLVGGALAQPTPGAALIERLNKMTPAQRQKVLSRMPAARRQLLEERIASFNRMAPEKRDQIRRELETFQQMPPERQAEVRRTLRAIADLPVERRQAVRRAVQQLRKDPPDVQQKRMVSTRFNERFSDEERKLIRDAVTLLPGQTIEEPVH